jgi:hypothetical protein
VTTPLAGSHDLPANTKPVEPPPAAEFLTDGRREEIKDLADLIVPGAGGLPSASDARVHQDPIGHALRARPDFIEPLTAVLDHLRTHPGQGLGEVDDEILEPVIELVVACYFMSPLARRSIGYNGQRAAPIAEGESEYYLEEDDVLAPVSARGSIWRSTPGDPV